MRADPGRAGRSRPGRLGSYPVASPQLVGAGRGDDPLGRIAAILRHALAHTLGLGHAARPGLLMHHRIPPHLIRHGRGDLRGLALLGPAAAL